MSINALSNVAVARRWDFQPADSVPATLAEITCAAVAAPVPVAVVPAGENESLAPADVGFNRFVINRGGDLVGEQ